MRVVVGARIVLVRAGNDYYCVVDVTLHSPAHVNNSKKFNDFKIQTVDEVLTA